MSRFMKKIIKYFVLPSIALMCLGAISCNILLILIGFIIMSFSIERALTKELNIINLIDTAEIFADVMCENEWILDRAYLCLSRRNFKKTFMNDIASEFEQIFNKKYSDRYVEKFHDYPNQEILEISFDFIKNDISSICLGVLQYEAEHGYERDSKSGRTLISIYKERVDKLLSDRNAIIDQMKKIHERMVEIANAEKDDKTYQQQHNEFYVLSNEFDELNRKANILSDEFDIVSDKLRKEVDYIETTSDALKKNKRVEV